MQVEKLKTVRSKYVWSWKNKKQRDNMIPFLTDLYKSTLDNPTFTIVDKKDIRYYAFIVEFDETTYVVL